MTGDPDTNRDAEIAALHVCAFSGGIASAVMSKIVADAHPGQTVLLFHNTRTEPADNDRFRAEAAAYIGLQITDCSDGRDIWQVFEDHGFLGHALNTPCSDELKQKPGRRYMTEDAPGGIKYLGYTAEETGRAQKMFARAKCPIAFPLIDAGLTKRDCWRRVTECWGIRPPEMYAWAEHANCVPCVKGGLAYWGLVYLNAPEAWERAAKAEERFGHQILKPGRHGTLREELSHSIDAAKEHMAKRAAEEALPSLFDAPCECAL